MPLSPQTEHTLLQMATRTYNPRDLPVPSGDTDTIESFLREQNVIPACPRCGGRDIKKNGRKASRQRLRCKRCGKTFGLSSGTPYFRSKLPWSTWRAAVGGFERKHPLREIAAETGVSLHTLCSWRKRYLAGHLKVYEEILEEMQTKGLIRDDADLEKVSELIGAELAQRYRGHSLKVARERLYKVQQRILKRQGIQIDPYC